MEVYVRNVCLKCGGTAKNQMSDDAAIEEATITYLKYDIATRAMRTIPRPSIETIARELQTCKYCNNGYNTRWITLDKFKKEFCS